MTVITFLVAFLVYFLVFYKWVVLTFSIFNLLLLSGVLKARHSFVARVGFLLSEAVEPSLRLLRRFFPKLVDRGLGLFLLWVILLLLELGIKFFYRFIRYFI